MQAQPQTPRSTFKRGDKVESVSTETIWQVTQTLPDGRVECTKNYGKHDAVVLFCPNELRLEDPKPERSEK